MMMFADIIKYVEEKEYQLAVDALTPLLKNEDEKIVAKAHHILGYINTRHDYTEKSDYQAKRHLRFNLNSNYPHPYGYVLYSQVEEDSNVALNYLEKGVARFPQDARILLEYFRLAPNKNAVIQIVKERNVNDARLLSAVIDYLVSVNQWNDVCHFAVQLENGNNLRFLYKGIIIKHNKTEPTYTKTSLFLCEKRRFFMARTEKGVVTTI